MSRLVPTVQLLVCALAISAVDLNPLGAAEFRVGEHQFQVPEGFVVELAAGHALARRPVSASFDDHGRLYVTDSSGSNDRPERQLENPTHRILRLEDTDNDGTFDRSVVFAEGVMFPQGCLWHNGSVYVAGPPSIWKFTDTDGDGVADQKEEWFKGGTLTGCANDIHGPHLGPDGFLYWTKGAFAEQTHRLANGRVLNDRAAHIYRARPDGSGLDVIMSGGMDNPVEIAFTAEGEPVFTSTFIDFSQPGFRDGVAHAIRGGVFGKANAVIEDGRLVRTTPKLLQPFFQGGAAAECGICRYESDAWGGEYQDNLFSTSFNLHKVTRHVLKFYGASYKAESSAFLVSDQMDFHPTDVLMDADGSLLVVDTGGWYKLCCPSSQLAKPDVPGAIYRVRRDLSARPAGDELEAARARLAEPPGMAKSQIAELKRMALSSSPANAATFREHLARNAPSTRGDARAAHVVRVCAEGLGTLRDRESVGLLFEAIAHANPGDVFLTHALTYALIEIGDAEQVRAGLQSTNASVVGAALVALDQIKPATLTFSDMIPLLGSRLDGEEHLRELALWILHRQKEWSGQVAGYLRHQLSDGSANDVGVILACIPTLTQNEDGQALLSEIAAPAQSQVELRIAALRSMAGSRLDDFPDPWKASVREALNSRDPGVLSAGIQAARKTSKDSVIQDSLRRLALDTDLSAGVRMESLESLPSGAAIGDSHFDFLLALLSPSQPPSNRSSAAGLLAHLGLSNSQLHRLVPVLKTAGPLELNTLLGVFAGGGDQRLGEDLIAALRTSAAFHSIHPGEIARHFSKYPESVQKQADELVAATYADTAEQLRRLDSLSRELNELNGDIRRGQAIFNSPQAACVSCHRIGYLGGDIGPDLTTIGPARSERDLLEAIIYPSASFVRSYEPVRVITRSGEDYSGVLRHDGQAEIRLATGPGAIVEIPRSAILEIRPSLVSLMPQGLEDQISKQDLADLLAFLKNTRWGPQ